MESDEALGSGAPMVAMVSLLVGTYVQDAGRLRSWEMTRNYGFRRNSAAPSANTPCICLWHSLQRPSYACVQMCAERGGYGVMSTPREQLVSIPRQRIPGFAEPTCEWVYRTAQPLVCPAFTKTSRPALRAYHSTTVGGLSVEPSSSINDASDGGISVRHTWLCLIAFARISQLSFGDLAPHKARYVLLADYVSPI